MSVVQWKMFLRIVPPEKREPLWGTVAGNAEVTELLSLKLEPVGI